MRFTSTHSLALLTVAGTLFITGTGLAASETDDRIETAVSKSYVFKTYLKDDAIKAESSKGVVTLTGTVAEDSHKTLAENTVAGLPGVMSVNNRLTVKSDAPAEQSDAWVSTKVKTALLFHRNVSASGTDVYVKDGVVSLRGEVANLAQKELTEEYAKDVDGVKAVKNELTIAKTPGQPAQTPSEKIDDASITAQVKASLFSHRSTRALNTKVSTTDGVVTLGGVARNAAEKSLVGKLANDVHGVTRVINDMTITVPVAAN
jgi:hyperosmotically inducible protein